MTLAQFITSYNGKTIGYPTGSYVGECLSLVKQYMKEVYGFSPPPSGSNSAYGYWSNFPAPLGTYFEKILNTLEFLPEPGDIAIWNTKVGNGYGHIAIVTEKGKQNTFKSFDQNWGGKQAHIVEHNYDNVVGFLRPKGSMANELEVCMADRLKFWQERDAALAKVATLEKQVAELQAKLTACENKPTTPAEPDMSKWELNGMTVQTGNVVRNYKLKA